MIETNLNASDILTSARYPDRFPKGTVRKFGNTTLVTIKGMETVTGIKYKELEK